MRRVSGFLLVLASLVVGFTACGPSFIPGFKVVDERVLAVVAEPPEAGPGQAVTFTALVASPAGTVSSTTYGSEWWRCPDSDSDALQDATRCTNFDERIVLSEDAVYADRIPLDIFSLPDANPQPGDPPQNDKLLGALLGYWRVIGLSASFGDGKRIDAVKRVVASPPVPLENIEPTLADLDVRVGPDGTFALNTNPTLIGVSVREGDAAGAPVTTLERGKTYFLVPSADDTTLEAFHSLKMDLEGLDLADPEAIQDLTQDQLLARFERIVRCELPLYSWYVTDGELRRENTVDEIAVQRVFEARGVACPGVEGTPRNPAVRFVAPGSAGTVHGWVVLRDGRGGTDFGAFDLEIE